MLKFFKKICAYAVSVGIALAVSALSAFITMGKMSIMESLKHPPLTPPPMLFPIIWGILYALMGISAAIIYRKRQKNPDDAKSALTVYAASLAINFLWSIIFFNFENYLLAFVWLLLLLSLIICTIIRYKPLSKAAAYLQIPYAIWVTFAGYITFGIWLLNR